MAWRLDSRFGGGSDGRPNRPEPNTGCLLWTAFAAGDPGFEYGKFLLYEGTRREGLLVEQLAHRVSWRLYRGPIPEGLFICHHCDTPPCVNVDHLFLGTALDNRLDCIAKGRDRNASGEENGQREDNGVRRGIHPRLA